MIRSLLTPRRVRSIHRWLGLFFSLFVFTSAGSGLVHTIMSRTTPPPPPARPASEPLAIGEVRVDPTDAMTKIDLGGKPVRAVNFRQISGRPWYQIFVDGAEKPRYVSAVDGNADDSQDEAHAAEIAGRHLGLERPAMTSFLTRFDGEYGPIFRILPVYRFDKDDANGTRVYVSTTTGSVTMATDDARAAEARLFSMAHKWMFIRDKNLRDLLLCLAMCGIMIVSLAGIVLFVLTRPRKRAVPVAAGQAMEPGP